MLFLWTKYFQELNKPQENIISRGTKKYRICSISSINTQLEKLNWCKMKTFHKNYIYPLDHEGMDECFPVFLPSQKPLEKLISSTTFFYLSWHRLGIERKFHCQDYISRYRKEDRSNSWKTRSCVISLNKKNCIWLTFLIEIHS